MTSHAVQTSPAWRFPGRPGLSLCSRVPRRKSRHVIGPPDELSYYQPGVSISAPAVLQCIFPRQRPWTRVHDTKVKTVSAESRRECSPNTVPTITGNRALSNDEGERDEATRCSELARCNLSLLNQPRALERPNERRHAAH